MPGDSRATMAQNLPRWLQGNTEAISFILAVHGIVELWDDLIDRDCEIEDEAIHGAFYMALITLPRNRFYQAHFLELSPILEQAILDWHVSNDLEKRRKGDDLQTAFALRCGVMGLTVISARIIAGVAWAREVNLEMRSIGQTWSEYKAEFKVKK